MTSVVADTHTLIWYLCDTSKLSAVALAALDGAINTNNPNLGKPQVREMSVRENF